MSDLEIVRACAVAMGIKDMNPMCSHCDEYRIEYDPLHDDAQAMALVKRFRLRLNHNTEVWQCEFWNARSEVKDAEDQDLNRAICLCVSRLSGV